MIEAVQQSFATVLQVIAILAAGGGAALGLWLIACGLRARHHAQPQLPGRTVRHRAPPAIHRRNDARKR